MQFIGKSHFFTCLILTFLLANSSSERVASIGNEIKGSSTGVDIQGATFLLNDPVKMEGVVFAYSAFFREVSKARLQIWRPITETNMTNQFELVSDIKVTPSVTNVREDVYVEGLLADACTKVLPGDRLGLFMEESPGAVAYTFESASLVLGYTVPNVTNPLQKGDRVTFDSLTFPYDFSLMAFIDTEYDISNLAGNEAECPKALFIPPYGDSATTSTTSTVPPTGAPGATGPIGQQGFTGATGPMGETGPLGFNGSMGATGMEGPEGPQGPAGGATGFTGPLGPQGATGSQGEEGPQGIQGIVGPPGPPGFVNTTSEKPVAAPITSENMEFLEDPLFLLGLLGWLGVVTIFVIINHICLCYFCCCKKTKETRYYESDRDFKYYDNVGSDFPKIQVQYVEPTANGIDADPQEEKPEWLSSMREDTFKEYCFDTIAREQSQKGQSNNHEHITKSDSNLYQRQILQTNENGGAMIISDDDTHMY